MLRTLSHNLEKTEIQYNSETLYSRFSFILKYKIILYIYLMIVSL